MHALLNFKADHFASQPARAFWTVAAAAAKWSIFHITLNI